MFFCCRQWMVSGPPATESAYYLSKTNLVTTLPLDVVASTHLNLPGGRGCFGNGRSRGRFRAPGTFVDGVGLGLGLCTRGAVGMTGELEAWCGGVGSPLPCAPPSSSLPPLSCASWGVREDSGSSQGLGEDVCTLKPRSIKVSAKGPVVNRR